MVFVFLCGVVFFLHLFVFVLYPISNPSSVKILWEREEQKRGGGGTSKDNYGGGRGLEKRLGKSQVPCVLD